MYVCNKADLNTESARIMCSEDFIHFSYLGVTSLIFSEKFLKKYRVYAPMMKEKTVSSEINVAKDHLLISVFTPSSFLLLPSRQLLLLSIDPS